MTKGHIMTSSHMTSLKQLQNRRLKQANILDTAEELFAQKGFDATSIDEITTSLGIAKGTFYLYFKSKDDILEAVTVRAQEMLINIINKATKKHLQRTKLLEELFVVYLEYSEKYPMYFEIYNTYFEYKKSMQASTIIQTNEDTILAYWRNTVLSELNKDEASRTAAFIHEILITLLSRFTKENSIKSQHKKYNNMIETFYELVSAKI
jgi:AcrR family transcriptional regulator